MRFVRRSGWVMSAVVGLALANCTAKPSSRLAVVPPPPVPGDPVLPEVSGQRFAPDTMLVAGEPVSVGTRVVLFTEPRGYNAYQSPHHFGPRVDRFNNGRADLLPEAAQRIALEGYTLEGLQEVVDRFVIHYDVSGCSSRCFHTLQHERGLSVHFMLDLDGTIYQTLDLQERAWHASDSNSRSIGIEIANVGAYPPGKPNPFARWYAKVPGHASGSGHTRLIVPADANLLQPHKATGPARSEAVWGMIHGQRFEQYDLTEAQYAALIKLTAALCRTFPRLPVQAPLGPDGRVSTTQLGPGQLRHFRGLIGHYHLTTHKADPGPAFDWARLLRGVRAEMGRWP